MPLISAEFVTCFQVRNIFKIINSYRITILQPETGAYLLMDKQVLHQIEQIIGYTFTNKKLLAKAFSHSSAVSNRLESNERLEFLGDAILGIIICQELFEQYQDYLEGDLTKMKSALVSRQTCSKVAKQLQLQKYLQVGKGMLSNRGLPLSLAAGVLEALIAAIYIDGGIDKAREFIIQNFQQPIEELDSEEAHGNYKSMLQQYAQEHYSTAPVYILLDEKGPDHHKCFESEAVLNGRHFLSAWGASKKVAEQKAAYNALIELGIIKENNDVKNR
jgi:ribonuclease-3